MKPSIFLGMLLLGVCSWSLNGVEIRKLLPPELSGGQGLQSCLAQRHTSRAFSARPLPPQILSNLFFAADGVTRSDGRKTVPTARNARNQIIYAAMANGLWRYLPEQHALRMVSNRDIRSKCGLQKFHQIAPVVLIYVSQKTKVGQNEKMQLLYSGAHCGFASQNVYLYAASAQLATVVCGMVNRAELAPELPLQKDEIIIFTQPVGYPGN